jgi:hypothetical protein
MKLKLIVPALLVFAMTATACSGSGAPAAATEALAPTTAETTTGEMLGLGNTGLSGLFGEIKDIAGNEVTLLLIENQTGTEEGTPGTGMKRGNGGADVVREYTGEEKTLLIPVGTLMVKRVPQSGTGETGTSTGTGPVEEEVSLKELTKGSTLKIFYYENTTDIEKIIVQPPRN